MAYIGLVKNRENLSQKIIYNELFGVAHHESSPIVSGCQATKKHPECAVGKCVRRTQKLFSVYFDLRGILLLPDSITENYQK